MRDWMAGSDRLGGSPYSVPPPRQAAMSSSFPVGVPVTNGANVVRTSAFTSTSVPGGRTPPLGYDNPVPRFPFVGGHDKLSYAPSASAGVRLRYTEPFLAKLRWLMLVLDETRRGIEEEVDRALFLALDYLKLAGSDIPFPEDLTVEGIGAIVSRSSSSDESQIDGDVDRGSEFGGGGEASRDEDGHREWDGSEDLEHMIEGERGGGQHGHSPVELFRGTSDAAAGLGEATRAVRRTPGEIEEAIVALWRQKIADTSTTVARQITPDPTTSADIGRELLRKAMEGRADPTVIDHPYDIVLQLTAFLSLVRELSSDEESTSGTTVTRAEFNQVLPSLLPRLMPCLFIQCESLEGLSVRAGMSGDPEQVISDVPDGSLETGSDGAGGFASADGLVRNSFTGYNSDVRDMESAGPGFKSHSQISGGIDSAVTDTLQSPTGALDAIQASGVSELSPPSTDNERDLYIAEARRVVQLLSHLVY